MKKTTLLYRIASILLVLFAVGHTVGFRYANHSDSTAHPDTPPLPAGKWKIEKVSGYADTPVSDRDEYLGHTLSVDKHSVTLDKFNETPGPARRWDTSSKDWTEEFRTDPKTIGLSRWVTVYDLVFAKAILLRQNKLLVDLGGTWYLAARQPAAH